LFLFSEIRTRVYVVNLRHDHMCEAQATCESDSPNFSSHKAVKPLGFTFLSFSEAIGRPSIFFNKYFRIFKFFLYFVKLLVFFKTNFKFLIVFSQKTRLVSFYGARRRKIRRQGNYNCNLDLI
jgi:hypothetical protein